LIALDVVNPLTPFWLGVTTFFETGMGFAVYLCWTWGIPKLRARAEVQWPEPKMRLIHDNRIINYFWFTKWLGFKGWRQELRPYYRNRKTYIAWAYGAKGLAYLAFFVTLVILLFNKGWVNPFGNSNYFNLNTPGWLFDLIFSRANVQPNGAHDISYISMLAVGLVAYAKWRDPFLALGCISFVVVLHEGFWEAAYYAVYSVYITSWALLTNVLKDVSFASMLVFFYLGFKNYPYKPFNLRIFKWPAIIFGASMLAWVFVPYFFGYGLMPITTLNNFIYGQGIYSETVYWGNAIVNAIEVGSWVEAALLVSIPIALVRKNAP
jgi:hypothetical protein